MKFYLSSKDIPALAQSSTNERNEKVYRAQQKLTVPEKFILSILKLMLLIPPFLFIARQDWGNTFFSLMICGLAFMLVFKPISFVFIERHL
ncbi:DUF6170 family protein [Thalassotalea euphylliae]|uniref:Uncharacterized protein n=1 Tax=Thalassotalea euphylliae TaxID=1655234 RepID=A0A3E0U0S7_9GAMM|nr:DUF6170 family protein [Thalassotalea euphylliae]REL30207.1 hypothetical protein DXX94_05525 [Thalassotalea euphylliae]